MLKLKLSSEHKKYLITLLLLVSCIVSAFLLIFTPADEYKELNSLAEADSLIARHFADYSIPDEQIQTATVDADTLIQRKNYYVSLPRGFSKTHFHAELNRALNPLKVETPAKVTFPSRDMLIQLVYSNTVIRSISLRTDPDLILQRYPASIVVATEDPTDDLLNDIEDFGEPISIALHTEDPMELEEAYEKISNRQFRLLFWLQSDGGDLLETQNENRLTDRFSQLQELRLGASLISFSEPDTSVQELLSEYKLRLLDMDKSVRVNENDSEEDLRNKLQQLNERAREGVQPVLLLPASRELLSSLKTLLGDVKKEGLYLTPPADFSYD